MPKPLMAALQDDDEKAVLVIAAAVALHGLLAGGSEPGPNTVKLAFDLSEQFQAEAARRVGVSS